MEEGRVIIPMRSSLIKGTRDEGGPRPTRECYMDGMPTSSRPFSFRSAILSQQLCRRGIMNYSGYLSRLQLFRRLGEDAAQPSGSFSDSLMTPKTTTDGAGVENCGEDCYFESNISSIPKLPSTPGFPSAGEFPTSSCLKDSSRNPLSPAFTQKEISFPQDVNSSQSDFLALEEGTVAEEDITSQEEGEKDRETFDRRAHKKPTNQNSKTSTFEGVGRKSFLNIHASGTSRETDFNRMTGDLLDLLEEGIRRINLDYNKTVPFLIRLFPILVLLPAALLTVMLVALQPLGLSFFITLVGFSILQIGTIALFLFFIIPRGLTKPIQSISRNLNRLNPRLPLGTFKSIKVSLLSYVRASPGS